MKKRPVVFLASAILLAFSSLAADEARLLARLPSVDKLPATCEVVVHVDFQGLQSASLLAKGWSSGSGAGIASALLPSGILGQFGQKFLEDIQELLYFQVNPSSDPEKKTPSPGAYLRGAFRRSEFLKAFAKDPVGKVGESDLYAIESSNAEIASYRFAFLAENVMLVGKEPAIGIALKSLHGKAPSLTKSSPIAKIFQNDRSYLLGLAKSSAISFGADGSAMAEQVSAFGLGGLTEDPPSAYLISLAPVTGNPKALRASLDLAFRTEQSMIQARDGFNSLLAFLMMGAQENQALRTLHERLKVTGLHKRVRIALEVDEKLLALATAQIEAVGAAGAGGDPMAGAVEVPVIEERPAVEKKAAAPDRP